MIWGGNHMKRIRKYIGVLLCLIVFAAMAMGSGSDTSVDNSNASGASDKTGTESDNVVMVGGSFEKDGLKGTVNDADTDFTDYDDPYGFYKPGDGKKYVKADFSFENKSLLVKFEFLSLECLTWINSLWFS